MFSVKDVFVSGFMLRLYARRAYKSRVSCQARALSLTSSLEIPCVSSHKACHLSGACLSRSFYRE